MSDIEDQKSVTDNTDTSTGISERKRPRDDGLELVLLGAETENGQEEDVEDAEQAEDDEDEDDEDDDDEDEDEDDVRRTKRSRTNQFLDIEADVDDEEEDEEEGEEEEEFRKEFIADDHAPGEGGEEHARAYNDAKIHRRLLREEQEANDQDVHDIAEALRQRYGRSGSSRFRGAASGQVSQRLLLPSVDDPSIWAIRCRQGKEKELVRQIMKKKISLQHSKTPLEIFSCFQRDNFSSYIYIEARKVEAVTQALSGLVGIFGNQGRLLVPIEEYPDLLRATKSSDVEVVPGIYVRIKQGKYKGDLAIVEDLAENGLEVRLKVVPRVDYGKNTVQQEYIDKNNVKKIRTIQNSKARPPARLFSEQDASTYDPRNLSRRGRNAYIYKGDEYTDGFLYKDFRLAIIDLKNVNPTLEELTRFNAGNEDEGIDLSKIAESLKQSSTDLITFQPGDVVEVTSGEQTGIRGLVISSQQGKIVQLQIQDASNPQLNNSTIEVPSSSLRKIFLTGDHVRVIHGKHKDDTGLIVAIDADQVTFISDQTRNAIIVFSNYLIKSTDTSSSFTKVGDYELHDLVQLNSDNVGIITRAEKELFTVLLTDGRTLKVSPSAVQSKVDIPKNQQSSTDKNGFEIKTGDTVKETLGERRTGTILHIYRTSLFLKSKTVVENLGVFVTNSSNVQTIAAKGMMSNQFKTPDLTKMNPSRSATMAPPPPAQRMVGRDLTINKRVKIVSGGHKGKQGIVKDGNGDTARVELHAPTKMVTVNKSNLKFEVEQTGTYISYEDFVKTRGRGFGGSLPQPRGSSNNGRGTSYGGSNGPSWGSRPRSEVPYQSSQPAWASNNSGAKTPAWGSAINATLPSNGGGSAWGGSSAYGGGNRSSWGGGASSYGGANNGGAKTPSWGSKTPAWGGASVYGGAGGKTPSWGGASAYGNRSAWDPNSGGHGSESNHAGNSWDTAPTPGNTAPTPGAWNAVTPAVNDDDYEP